MDIQLARTFLEVISAGNFVNAAKRLHVTQSAVSLRIRKLEQELGRPVFIRSKAGTELTAAGAQFQRYATSLLKVWEEAKQQVAIPPGFRAALSVGGQYSLWDRLLLRWLPGMQARAPDIAIRADVGMPPRLMREMVEGIIDLAVMYTPQLRPGLEVELLFDDELVLASTSRATTVDLDAGYIFMDWGPEFQAAHGITYAGYTNPGTSLALGALALGYIVRNGKSGYLPKRAIRGHLDRGELHLVPNAPVFPFPAYVVYHKAIDSEVLDIALDELRRIAREIDEHSEGSEILGSELHGVAAP